MLPGHKVAYDGERQEQKHHACRRYWLCYIRGPRALLLIVFLKTTNEVPDLSVFEDNNRYAFSRRIVPSCFHPMFIWWKLMITASTSEATCNNGDKTCKNDGYQQTDESSDFGWKSMTYEHCAFPPLVV